MYKMIFISENGKKFLFGTDNNNVFDADLGDGVSVKIGTSQGFSQIGETFENRTITGRKITVSGTFYGKDIPEHKSEMRRLLTPLSRGRLVFEDHEIPVFVSQSPTFSPVRNDGRFSLQFFAPYPFFKSTQAVSVTIGSTRPAFSFPVNYNVPHKFGETEKTRYVNVRNDGDIPVPFEVYIRNSTESSAENVTLVNFYTLQRLTINGTLFLGETIHIYRDHDGVLHADLIADDEETDIISRISEDSALFELDVGDNLIGLGGEENLYVRFLHNPAVVNVYES